MSILQYIECTHVGPSDLYEGLGSLGRARWVDPFWLVTFGCALPAKAIQKIRNCISQ